MKELEITVVANGYILRPPITMGQQVAMNTVLVFETLPALFDFLKKYLEKPNWRKNE